MSFTIQELKILKYKMMKRGMKEAQAEKEIAGMIKTTRINHLKAVQAQKDDKAHLTFKDSFRALKEGKS